MDVACRVGDHRVGVVDRRVTPMIRTVCDVCDIAIGRVFGDWFGVDYARLDDDGELIEPTIDHEFHFCSTDHLVAWAMQRSYLPEGTNTP